MAKDTQKSTKKDAIFWKILDSAIKLEIKKGAGKWSLSELSRVSKVNRPLIYYYFGKDKNQIMISAVRILGELLFGVDPQRKTHWAEGNIAASIEMTCGEIREAPHIILFYLQQRQPGSLYEKEIIALEKKFYQRIKSYSPKVKDETLRAIYSMVIGCIALNDLTHESIEAVANQIKAMLI